MFRRLTVIFIKVIADKLYINYKRCQQTYFHSYKYYEPCYWQTRAVFTNLIDNIINHVDWQTRAVFTNVIDNIMNHVYRQTRAIYTNVIDNIMNHVYWQTREYLPMSLIIL